MTRLPLVTAADRPGPEPEIWMMTQPQRGRWQVQVGPAGPGRYAGRFMHDFGFGLRSAWRGWVRLIRAVWYAPW